MKNIVRDEKGAALMIALILLLIGGLISAALLNHMGSGILSGMVHERRTAELYAADAGVEDAIWKIQNQVPEVAKLYQCNDSWSYNITDTDGGVAEVNDKRVEVTITVATVLNDLPSGYRIVSRAIGDGDGSGGVAAIDSNTAVEAYVSFSYMDFSSLLDHAIVSFDTISVQPNNYIDGDVWLPDEEDLDNKGEITGEVKDNDDLSITWPTAEQLAAYYYEDVEGTYDPGPFIDVKFTDTIGPCYREGGLAVDNTGDPDTLVLEGTVYVAGDLEFYESGNSKNYTIDLNGHTIFAEGSIEFPSQVVGISGPGCIIAVGDIDFQPSIAGDDFVLVLSITGIVQFHPSGDFTGCVAGNVNVDLLPNSEIYWISPEGKGLDFPGADGGEEPPSVDVMNIESWEIIQQ